MSNLSHSATLDTTDYISGINRLKKETSSFTKSAVDGMDDLDARLRTIGVGIASYFSVAAVKNFTSEIIRVRGEFQQLEIGLETMLGNKAKADALMRQVIEFAAKTPFDLQQVAAGTKQLIAYGVASEEVIPTMRRLGDIASGLGLAFGDMAYLYGTTRVQGRLYAQDLRQFTGRGIPLIEQLAKQFNVATGEVNKLVSEGKVGFPEVEKAIKAMTDEGGRFYNLTEKNSKTLSGMISNLGDSIQQMYNDLGKSNQALLTTGIEGVATLVDHWREIGKVLAVIITAYGSYKAAVLAVAAAEKIMAGVETVKTFIALTKEVHSAKDAMLLFNMACKANPFVLLSSVATTAFVAFKMFGSSAEEATKDVQGLTKAQEKADLEFEKQKASISVLQTAIEDETTSVDNKRKAIEKLQKIIPGYTAELNEEGKVISSNTAKIKEYLTQLEKQIKLKAAQEELEDLYRKKYAAERDKRKNQKILDENKPVLDAQLDAANREADAATRVAMNSGEAAAMAVTSRITNVDEALLKTVSDAEHAVTSADETLSTLSTDIEELQKDISSTSAELDAAAESGKNTGGTLEEQTKRARDQVSKLKKELNDLRSGKTKSEDYAKAIEDKGKELKAAEAKLQMLLKGPKDTNSGDGSSSLRSRIEREIEWKERLVQQKIATENAITQAGIDAMQEGTGKELAEREFAYKKELQSIKAKADEMRKATYEYNKRVWEDRNKEGAYEQSAEGRGGWQAIKLTSDQQREIDALISSSSKKWEMYQQENMRKQLENLHSFLQEYGTIEQQRYAITKKYDALIAAERNSINKQRLQKEKQSALAGINARSLAQNIDWAQSFKGVGDILEGIAKETLTKVKSYMQTAEFKSLSAADKKAYYDLRQQLVEAGGVDSKSPFKASTWTDIAKYAEVYKSSVKNLIDAQERHKKAVDDLISSEEELKKATGVNAKAIAISKNIIAKQAVETTSNEVSSAEQGKADATEDLNNATEAASKGLENFTSLLNQLTSGSLSGFAVGVYNVINQLTGSSKAFANSLGEIGGKLGGIIGAILQIIDALGDKPDEFIESILEKVSAVIEAVLSKLPEIIVAAVKGVGNIVGSVIKGVANLFSGGAAFGSNVAEMEKEIAELSEANKSLEKAVGNLIEVIKDSDSTNKDSIDAYNQAIKAEKEWEANQRKAINDRASEWSNSGHGFLGLSGEHSFNYYANDLGFEVWRAFTTALKEHGFNKSINSVEDLWNLSPEEMRVLRDFAPSAWAKLLNTGGESNPKELLEEYINRAGSLDSLSSALNEKLTGYTWDSFKDSYVSMLKDLTSTTEDFADNIEELISNALISAFVNSSEIQSRVKGLYEKIAKYAGLDSEGGTTLTEGEINDLRQTNEKLAEDMLAWRDAAVQAGLIKQTASEFSQSASTGGFQAMSQDAGEELNGRFTAIQMNTAQIYASVVETVNLLIIQNDHLANIEKYTKLLSEISDRLEKIESNTSEL